MAREVRPLSAWAASEWFSLRSVAMWVDFSQPLPGWTERSPGHAGSRWEVRILNWVPLSDILVTHIFHMQDIPRLYWEWKFKLDFHSELRNFPHQVSCSTLHTPSHVFHLLLRTLVSDTLNIYKSLCGIFTRISSSWNLILYSLTFCFVGRNWACHLFDTYPFHFTCDKIYPRSSALTVIGWQFALRVPGAIGLFWLTRTWPGSQGKNKVDVFVTSSQRSRGRVAKMIGKVQSALHCTHSPHASFASWNSTHKMQVACSSEKFMLVS